MIRSSLICQMFLELLWSLRNVLQMPHLFIPPPHSMVTTQLQLQGVCVHLVVCCFHWRRGKRTTSTGLHYGWEWVETGRKLVERFKTWQFDSSLGKQTNKKSMTFILPSLKFQKDGPPFGSMIALVIIDLSCRIFLLIKTSKALRWSPFCGVGQREKQKLLLFLQVNSRTFCSDYFPEYSHFHVNYPPAGSFINLALNPSPSWCLFIFSVTAAGKCVLTVQISCLQAPFLPYSLPRLSQSLHTPKGWGAVADACCRHHW